MKKVTLIIRQTEISRIFADGFQLVLDDNASVLDAIKAADKEINKKCGTFPVKGFKSLFHMVYHPREERFYKQVAIHAHAMSKPFMNIKENPKLPLLNKITIILIPQGGCQTDWEEQVK
jgi:hypothetical protein